MSSIEDTGSSSDTGQELALLEQATCAVLSAELPWMVLDKGQLPAELSGFELLRESELDNESMAKHGFGSRTAKSMAELGRITGYVREFAVTPGAPTLAEEPAEIVMAATVVHLFDTREAVSHWIDEVFVRDFRRNVGQELEGGQRVTGVERLEPSGFHDHAAALLVLQEIPANVLGSTIVDFRVGCLLGVAYVVAKRDVTRLDLAQEMGLALERQIVRVVLDAA